MPAVSLLDDGHRQCNSTLPVSFGATLLGSPEERVARNLDADRQTQERRLGILQYFLARETEEEQFDTSPAIKEIAERLGRDGKATSTSTVHSDLKVLERAGDLVGVQDRVGRSGRRPGRSYRLTKQGRGRAGAAVDTPSVASGLMAVTQGVPTPSLRLLPIIGALGAGPGTDVDLLAGESHTLGDVLNLGSDDVVFEVRGVSMIDAGIEDGDYVIVRPHRVQPARPGDVVVALVRAQGSQDRVLKRLILSPDGGVVLRSASATATADESPAPQEKSYDPSEVTVEGTPVWIVRRSRGRPRA